jgi:hypothetical protein
MCALGAAVRPNSTEVSPGTVKYAVVVAATGVEFMHVHVVMHGCMLYVVCCVGWVCAGVRGEGSGSSGY